MLFPGYEHNETLLSAREQVEQTTAQLQDWVGAIVAGSSLIATVAKASDKVNRHELDEFISAINLAKVFVVELKTFPLSRTIFQYHLAVTELKMLCFGLVYQGKVWAADLNVSPPPQPEVMDIYTN